MDNEIEITFEFTCERFSCINHACTATVAVDPLKPEGFEVLEWSDGYSTYEDTSGLSDRNYDSLTEAVEYECDELLRKQAGVHS